jgi:hypothetical protein
MSMSQQKWRLLALGASLGAVYGVLAYFVFSARGQLGYFSYLGLVPVGMAALPLLFDDADQIAWYRSALFAPWVGVVGSFLVLLLVKAEGVLCLLVLGAPFVLAISFGVWLVRALRIRTRSRTKRALGGGALLLLPFVVAPIEARWLVREASASVEESITVRASPAAIWRQLVTVSPLAEDELPAGIWNRLGVPRPRSATVTGQRVGATRFGEFENGLRFVEPIRAYDAGRRLELGVRVDRARLPADPSLKHALTGNYFRITRVRYRLAPIDGERTRLTLGCRYTLRSSVNRYGQAWASAIFSDFELRLLHALRVRAETQQRRQDVADGARIVAFDSAGIR